VVVRALQLGAVALGLAALPYKAFELDRFFVPKEVVLGAAATVALAAATRLRVPAAAPDLGRPAGTWDRLRRTPLDAALVAFLIVSAASGILAANVWLAARALALSAAGVALFWAARTAGRAGWAPAVLRATAALVAVAAGTALLQTYGLRTEYFSLNRAPGGTFGNRNFVAHLCALGLPVLAHLALRARTARGGAAATGLLAAAAAALVLTRSRAAWLATLVAGVPFAVGLARAALVRRGGQGGHGRPPTREGVRLRRAAALAAAAAVAALAAVRVPNALDWRSNSPYLESARGMVNYREGSGRGRLEQWRHSARLVVAHPVLGVGPGHWAAAYPAVAPASDPSLTRDRTTANPWPSSDWVATAAERGVLGLGTLGLAVLLLAWRAHHLVWRAATADARLLGGTLGAVLAATLTAGAFDAVLLLAAPSFLAWTAMGALVGAADRREGVTGPGLRRAPATALAALLALGTGLGAAHAAAMALYAAGRPRALARAAALAPGDYRIQLRAAQAGHPTSNCAAVRRAAGRALAIAPSAPTARRTMRACGTGRGGRSRP
jgi:O-antigen ligase